MQNQFQNQFQGQNQGQNQGQRTTRLDAYWAYRRNADGTMPEQPTLEVSVTSRIMIKDMKNNPVIPVETTQQGKQYIRFSLPIEGEKPIQKINTELGANFPTNQTLYLRVTVMGEYTINSFLKREYLAGDRIGVILSDVKLNQYTTQNGEQRVEVQSFLRTDLGVEKWRREQNGGQQAQQQAPQTNPFGGGQPQMPAQQGQFGQQAQQQAPQTNPFGGGQPQMPAQQANPFGGGQPQMPAQQANPFGGQGQQQAPQTNPFGGQGQQQAPQTNPFGGGQPQMPAQQANPFGGQGQFGGAPSQDVAINISDDDLPF